MKFAFRLAGTLVLFAACQVASMAQSDTTPPTLSALSFATSTVTVSSASQQLILNASITDDLSGVYYCTIIFQSPSGQLVSAGFNLISGTVLNGSYTTGATFPRFAEAGTWTASVEIFDITGNRALLSSSQLQDLGFPGTLTVVDATPDTTPPTLLGVTFSPTSVSTVLLPATVTVSLHVSDSQSGADFTHMINFAVTLSPTDATAFGPYQYLSTADFALVSGTAQNGTWQATKVMPYYSGGSWTLSQVTLYDAVTNKITLTPTQLTAMGISPVLTVTSSSRDITPPTLTGLSFTPTLINTTAIPAAGVISFTATDDLSGVSFTPATAALYFYDVYLMSPSGLQQVHSPLTPVLYLGIPLSGTWQFTTIWPAFSEGGTWSVFYVRVSDAVGNARIYSGSTLPTSNVSASFVIDAASYSNDGTVGAAGGVVRDSSFGSRASLTVPAGLVSSTTTVSIDVFPTSSSLPTPKGFTAPGTYFANLSFSPTLPTPVPSPGITVVLPLASQMTPGASLSLYHIDPVAGQTPAMNASGNAVVGTVDASGNTATFLHVVTFSSLIAYVSTGSTLGDVNGDGLVNCADVSIVKSSFGKRSGQAGYNIAADLNSDGTVDIRDLFVVSHQLSMGVVCQ